MSALSPCPTCSSPLPTGSRFCGSCGQPVLSPSSALPTVNFPPVPDPASRGASPANGAEARVTASRTSGDARFLPGAILADRYRIVGLLGKGGMGEVYRADDLKLGQPVALKFLPPGFDAHPGRLQRFLNEVRTARQVSHTNVCRVYDAGEADGQHFLSMEYVDGEDLSSLLRRIGHLPKDKAIQIARQLCAGLAAAHEMGILHRDLKPANVMIDGRGRARITDFGLAAIAGEITGNEIQSGTPAYMAPEQLAGREVTVRSDVYSLGLVLYELFTGKPAFQAASLVELRHLQSDTTPAMPSSLMEGFDPAVERIILRCLDADPKRRPASALSVAAALPGGDPLAAALAAGETPSPEMVAEAGAKGAASPAVLVGALGLFLACVVGVFVQAPRSSLVSMTPLEKPPDVLKERAREILAETGYDTRPADSLYSFAANMPYLEEILKRPDLGSSRWEILKTTPPGGILFWYRQSPRPLVPVNFASVLNWMSDPPYTTPGMARVGLDPEGRLISFQVVPGERTEPGSGTKETDWQPLLRATGLDPATLAPAEPEWAPSVYADRRAAWTGSWPGKPEIPLRVEVASAGGKPVALRVVAPWTRPAEEPAPPIGFWNRAAQLTNSIVFIGVVITAGVVALRNVRRGRGDRRGALRLALYLGAARMLWFLGAHHVAAPTELDLFVGHLSYSMQRVGLAYVFYLAIEPYARRLWPRMLISWVRVLEGRFRDPLVGRDLLIGSAAGALCALVLKLNSWVPALFGAAPSLPNAGPWTLETLRGTGQAVIAVVAIHTTELLSIIFPITLLLVFRIALRRTSLAVVAVTLVGIVLFAAERESLLGYLPGILVLATIYWVVLFRVGLLAFATMVIGQSLVEQMPLTPSPAGWDMGAILVALAAIAAPAFYGFWTARAGRPLIRDEILEPSSQH